VIRYTYVALLLVLGTASAAERFVPPPAPQIVDGTPVAVEREIRGPDQIIHIPRSSPADFRQFVGDYVVGLDCSGAHPFKAQLSPRTSPLGTVDEELIFVTLPEGQDPYCVLTVVDRSSYPWKRIFNGPIGSIPKIPD
jgi:hypothetical protein